VLGAARFTQGHGSWTASGGGRAFRTINLEKEGGIEIMRGVSRPARSRKLWKEVKRNRRNQSAKKERGRSLKGKGWRVFGGCTQHNESIRKGKKTLMARRDGKSTTGWADGACCTIAELGGNE